MMDLRRGHSSIIVFVPRHGNSYTRGYKWFEKDFHDLVSHNYPKFLFVQTIPVPREIIPMSLLRITQSTGFGSIYASLLSREAFALDLETKVDRSPTMVKGCHSFRLLLLQDFIKTWDKIIFPNWNGRHFPKENKDYSKNAIKLVLFFNFRKFFFLNLRYYIFARSCVNNIPISLSIRISTGSKAFYKSWRSTRIIYSLIITDRSI